MRRRPKAARLMPSVGCAEAMAFKALFFAHAADNADKEKDRSIIDTKKYRLFTVAVRNQAEALEVCNEFVEEASTTLRFHGTRRSYAQRRFP
jgi:hypothetical protein